MNGEKTFLFKYKFPITNCAKKIETMLVIFASHDPFFNTFSSLIVKKILTMIFETNTNKSTSSRLSCSWHLITHKNKMAILQNSKNLSLIHKVTGILKHQKSFWVMDKGVTR